MKSCKTKQERDLVSKEYLKEAEMEIRAKMNQYLAKGVERFMQLVAFEREGRGRGGGEAFPKHLEDRLQLVVDRLNDLTNATHIDL